MDSRSFDHLARSLVVPRTRRGLLGSLAALGAAVLGARSADAQVSQVSCGNQTCANNPGKCGPNCVCCLYTNAKGKVTNSRCRPPGTCSPGVEACTTGVPGASCAANADCCSGICQGGTCVATVAGTCPAGANVCSGDNSECGNGTCMCVPRLDGGTFCANPDASVCGDCSNCLPGYVCVGVEANCCAGESMCAAPCPPDGGTSCFTGDTLVAMADGTTRPIADVRVGDRVLGQTGVNRVEAIERPRLGARRLYALNGGAFFVTAEHPFLTEAGWKAVDPAATAAENPALAVGRLTVGDRLLALAGVAAPVLPGGKTPALEPRFAAVQLGSLIGMPADPATPLYNLRLDGDHTYVANDLVVHNK